MKAQELRSLYDHGYFHGVNSGYPAEGYAQFHPVWNHWIDYVLDVRPRASRWLDIGCAFGYLVLEARQKGFQVFGCDISSYALDQAADARQYLVESLAESMPFGDGTFDVISVFDVIEHLHTPELAVSEISRLLKPGGLCIGSTPDPSFFARHEATHFSENPPSFWHHLFRSHGLEMVLRFAGEPFNMEFAAVRTRGWERDAPLDDLALTAFRHDRFHPDTDIVRLAPPLKNSLLYAYRSGWSVLQGEEKDHRICSAPDSSIYLLNTNPQPLSLEIELTIPLAGKFGSCRAQLDDRPIGSFHLENVDEIRAFRMETALVSEGGHHLRLFFENNLTELPVQKIAISGRTVSHEHLIASFPFDLFQRYELARQVLTRIYAKSVEGGKAPGIHIVDIGGVMGGADGHMGSFADFLPGWQVQISDVRLCDIPHFVRSTQDSLPFSSDSCDVLLCLDVFEHIPRDLRTSFLSRLLEIPRQLLILACPCYGAEVVAAEEVLDEFIRCKVGYRHSFIAEHLEYGLPKQHEIEEVLRSKRLEFVSLPNGYIHRWLFMQLVTFYVSTLQSARLLERINRFYNEEFFLQDNMEPSYRRAFLVDTRGRGLLRGVDFAGICADGRALPADHWSERAVLLLQLLNADELERGKIEVKKLGFLLGEREKYISDLLRHIRNLEVADAARVEHLRNLESENSDFRQHVKNLEAEREDWRQHAMNLDTHRDSLQSNLLNFQSALADKDNATHQLQQAVAALENERMNLLRRINEVELDRLEIQKQAMELDTQNLELGKRLSSMEVQLSDSQNQQEQMQSRMKALETEYSRLSGLFSGRDLRDIVPLLKEFFKRSVR